MANKLQIKNMCYSAACVHVTLFVLECVHIKFNNYIVLDITWSVQDAQSLQLVTNLFTVILIPFQHLPTLGIVSKLVLEKKFCLLGNYKLNLNPCVCACTEVSTITPRGRS